MKRYLFWKSIYYALVYLLLTFSFTNYGQESAPVLKLKITSENKSFMPGQSVYVKVEIENTSSIEQCFRTIFNTKFMLSVNGKVYSLNVSYCWEQAEYAPPATKIYNIAGQSSISRLAIIRANSKEVDLAKLQGSCDVFAELPIEPTCEPGRYQYASLTSNTLKFDITPLPKEEKSVWEALRNYKVPEQYGDETNLIYFLPNIFWAYTLEDKQISAIRSFISKYPKSYYSDKLNLTLAFDMAMKGNFKESDRLFAEVKEKDDEYYFLKMRTIHNLYYSSLSNEEAVDRANKILEEVLKNQGKGILSEEMKKKLKSYKEWIEKWKKIRHIKEDK